MRRRVLQTWLVVLSVCVMGGGLLRNARSEIDLFTPARPKAPPPPSDRGPSTVIYPAQRLPIKFSHAAHLRRGATCLTCHEQAQSSMTARDNLLPGEAACRACHEIDRQEPEKRVDGPPAACSACHRGSPSERLDIPPPNLKFNHRLHADAKIECSRCHGDMTQVELATRAQLPATSVA